MKTDTAPGSGAVFFKEKYLELSGLTAAELGRRIAAGDVKVREALDAVFARIDAVEDQYHCYITIDKEKAFAEAVGIQERIDTGALRGPLAGVPVAVKDNLCTAGRKTTCASKILHNFVPFYTATAVERLQAAGAVILGKTNMDEFAMGSTTETSAYGVTKNPWDVSCVPGGSSGGSAAAVAAGECLCALGSDTGGSIRQPAALCGVVGIKPTYGTVSRYGLVAYASSMDQVGPLAGDVTDAATILEVISGYDEKDSTSLRRQDRQFTAALREDVKGIRIGIPKAYFGEGLDPEVAAAVRKAAEDLRAAGAVVEEFDLKYTEYAIPAYYTIADAEAGSNLERFDGIKYGYRAPEYTDLHDLYKKTRSEGFGTEVKRRIMLGAFVLSSGYYDAYYRKALKVRAQIKKAFDEAFAKYDVLLGPVTPSTAPKLGESLKDPLKMYLSDIYTVPANLAGLPAISLPCGKDRNGLPIGLQLTADGFREDILLRTAYTYEKIRGGFESQKI
ncbi:MAG: Asp-tRNA(Asn)/Glu-tRNA(Gln) amidotransferase subunit GatA [Lachnospiraceae bacterium]|nr:Asp-tRNA(Asn)/Glu-tRNA(Gln) amidotransferase subunit GatA [Lachnospiraceae bacterium]